MSETTGIAWTDHTFNIAWGCEKVSPGCAHCYADGLSRRYGHDVWGAGTARRTFGAKHWGEPLKWNAKAERDGVRRRVFCSSMCDVFEDHPTIDAERDKLWPLIEATPSLDWQLLTKRAERIATRLPWGDYGDPWPNVWLGVSVENQRFAHRAACLATIPATVRFISAEPLLGPLNLGAVLSVQPDRTTSMFPCAATGPSPIHWVIVGGESGPKHRTMNLEWASVIGAQCATARVAFFMKQDSSHRSGQRGRIPDHLWRQEFPHLGDVQVPAAGPHTEG